MPLAAPTLASPHLRSDLDLTPAEIVRLIHCAAHLKRDPAAFAHALAGRYLSLLFEKPSLRTRFTFDLAIQQLGGGAVTQIGPIGDREPLADIARNLDRWTSAIVARVFSQDTIEELARCSRVPVINALSDLYHPCQILADVQTIHERFQRWEGLKLAYIGDGNNIAHSLLLNAGRLGIHIAISCPPTHAPLPAITAAAKAAGVHFTITPEPRHAVDGAHVVYTDVWTSMGQESEALERQRIFAPYQVNAPLLAAARPEAIFLHCLPAKRGQEVTGDVIESPQSAVFDQAENRLHAQKALLLLLLR